MLINYKTYISLSLFLLLPLGLNATQPLTLVQAIDKALAAHPEVSSAKSNLEAEQARISFSQSPKDPMFGVMYAQNQDSMWQQGSKTSLSLSQDSS